MKRARGKGTVGCGAGLSPPEHVCEVLRDIQWETNCSTLTLQKVLDALHGRLGKAVQQCKAHADGLPTKAYAADKKMTKTVCVISLIK